MLNMEVNGQNIHITLYENSSTQEFKKLLEEGTLTLEMKDYAHMEKFASIGRNLPRNDRWVTTRPGDLILSEEIYWSFIMPPIPGILPGWARWRTCRKTN